MAATPNAAKRYTHSIYAVEYRLAPEKSSHSLKNYGYGFKNGDSFEVCGANGDWAWILVLVSHYNFKTRRRRLKLLWINTR